MTHRDLRQRMLAGQEVASATQATVGERKSPLSTLSINESLFLASSGWEPVDVCAGAAFYGMRQDSVNTWGSAQDQRASEALVSATVTAVERLEASCVESGAHGVIGTTIVTEIQPRYIAVNLVGTAIRPSHTSRAPDRPFTSNLPARAFVLLLQAGWMPLGLASGGQFVRVYRRTPNQTVQQKIQNVELTNPTEALARARSETMVLLERRAHDFGGQGVVELSLTSGPVHFATHVLSFVAWGTVVAATASDAVYAIPRTAAVTLNDAETTFDPGSLVEWKGLD
jgi:uncharacterized protein YbjQ (UPF0145 family)